MGCQVDNRLTTGKHPKNNQLRVICIVLFFDYEYMYKKT